MLLTEQEARQSECPFFRYVVNEGRVYHDREPAIYVHRMCQGSACKMGWRWVYERKSTYIAGVTPHEWETIQHEPPAGEGWEECGRDYDDGSTFAECIWRRPVKGYCGIAGKPEA